MMRAAIVRTPGKSLVNGITSSGLGRPDYQLALIQHRLYIEALRECGLEVEVLDAREEYPDSTFVEDVAVLTANRAVITRPGSITRRGETQEIMAALTSHFPPPDRIEHPGTIDGGDVMRVGSHFYIGLSRRTNEAGARQLLEILSQDLLTGSMIPVSGVLHLKTGVTCIENETLVISEEFSGEDAFKGFRQLQVTSEELPAANCLWINGRVLVPKGFPAITGQIASLGYDTICLDISEFQKIDGGLSCLSLRF